MIDLHNHSAYSPDSETPLCELFAEAESKGLEYFGISEHADLTRAGDKIVCSGDYLGYFGELKKIKRKKYKCKMLFGIEIGYDELFDVSHYREILSLYPLDYVIVSIHDVMGGDCYWAESFVGREKREFYSKYLEAVLGSVKVDFNYDIIGHLGYICRNAPYNDPTMHYSEFPDLIDEILREIIARDKAIELNTSVRTAGSTFLPNDEIIARYYNLGGRNITFGSDAHYASRIGHNYFATANIAKSIGFEYYDVFINHERKKVKI